MCYLCLYILLIGECMCAMRVGEKVLVTPIGTSYTMNDFNATVAENVWGFWDDSWRNVAELHQCFAFVSNREDRIVATGRIVGITEDTDPFVREALLNWEAHQAGRRVLLLRMDKTPAFQGSFSDVFTKSGIVMGTGNRMLKEGVEIIHNPR